MNRYGAIAKSHWQEWLPVRYRRLEDPNGFFDQLGRQAETEIETLHRAMLSRPPADLAEDRRAGWRAQARTDAEYQILAELILLDPEDDEERPAGPDGPHQSMTTMMNALYDATDPFGPNRD